MALFIKVQMVLEVVEELAQVEQLLFLVVLDRQVCIAEVQMTEVVQVEVELELRPMEEMQPLQLLVQEEVHWVVMVAMELFNLMVADI